MSIFNCALSIRDCSIKVHKASQAVWQAVRDLFVDKASIPERPKAAHYKRRLKLMEKDEKEKVPAPM